MNFSYYKRLYPNDVLVYVEEFNKQDKTVLFDFIDSNEYNLFTAVINQQNNLDTPTMVLLRNYNKRMVQENTIYSIKPETIQAWQSQILANSNDINSLLIGYIIDVANTEKEIFNTSISLNDIYNFQTNQYMFGSGEDSKIPLEFKGKITVTIRNVGQGNWNEISYDEQIKVVYDAGAPMYASRAEVTTIIGDRNDLYNISKPVLVLSHWDKDHYHSLLGMTNTELQNNFSAFVCRDYVPNLTSRKLFARIKSSVSAKNTFSISAGKRSKKRGLPLLKNMNATTNKIVIYNAEHHKNRNISGLLLTVKSSKASVILSGDAYYEQISRNIIPHLNFKHIHHLVVPHHGGKAGKYIYSKAPLMTFGKAIISVGPNRHKHPLSIYISALRKDTFVVEQTNIVLKDIKLIL